MTDAGPAPLARTLGDIAPHASAIRTAVPEDGRDWWTLAALADVDTTRALVDRTERQVTFGRRAVAGAFLAMDLGIYVAGPLAAALALARRGWPVDPGRAAVHQSVDGYLNGSAVGEGTELWVLPGDDAAGAPGVVVLEDRAALEEAVAASLVDALTPVFATLRGAGRYGVPGAWGQTADVIHERFAGIAGEAGWADATRLVDAIARRVAALRVRPRPFPLAGGGIRAIKGTCCLAYQVYGEAEGYCSTCPRLSVEDRAARLAAEAGA